MFTTDFILVNALKVQLPTFDSTAPLKDDAILWQFSGFLNATGFWKQPIQDVWPDKIRHDDATIQETLRGCVIASGVDRTVFGKEIAAVLKPGQSEENFSNVVYRHTRDVDIEMEWEHAKGMDLQKLEAALHYSTAWIVQAAANLIAVNASPKDLTSLITRAFEKGSGNALWAASQLCQLVKEPSFY